MENATKALLIAAAVLISIVLIALGISLLNAGGDASKQVEGVSGEISDMTGLKTEEIVDDLLSMGGNEILIGLGDFKTKEILETIKISVAEGKIWTDILGKNFDLTYKNIVSGRISVNTNFKERVAVNIKRKKGSNKVEPLLYKLNGNNLKEQYWNDKIEIGKCYCFFLDESVYK